MSGDIHIKKSVLIAIGCILACLGVALLVIQLPDIKRELRMWTM